MGEAASSEVTKVAAATNSQDPEVGLLRHANIDTAQASEAS